VAPPRSAAAPAPPRKPANPATSAPAVRKALARPAPPAAVRAERTPPVVATPRPARPTGEPVADGPGIGGAAANVYGTTSARALFRRGLVEQASGGLPPVAEGAATGAPSNGSRPGAAPPRPDRPRRTRQLRAT
jgi:hypothetical protein